PLQSARVADQTFQARRSDRRAAHVESGSQRVWCSPFCLRARRIGRASLRAVRQLAELAEPGLPKPLPINAISRLMCRTLRTAAHSIVAGRAAASAGRGTAALLSRMRAIAASVTSER